MWFALLIDNNSGEVHDLVGPFPNSQMAHDFTDEHPTEYYDWLVLSPTSADTFTMPE